MDRTARILPGMRYAAELSLCGGLRAAVVTQDEAQHAIVAIALWGGERSLLAGDADPAFVANPLHEAFGDRLYALATRHRRAEELRQETRLRRRAERCDFSVDRLRYRYPSERLPDGTTSSEWLHQLTLRGARERHGGTIPPDTQRQLDRELALIDELEYCGYFLTMYEIVRFCRDERIICQGRGSAANSAVCYCLGITAVDPVRMGLLFERFLSRERAEPPDIDLDIEHNRREAGPRLPYLERGNDYLTNPESMPTAPCAPASLS